MIKNHKYIFFFLFALVLTGCSTKKNRFANRAFHNLHARFNGYFYAEESIKEGVVKIQQSYKENYLKILPVFVYADANDAKNIYPEMDKAIKKSSLVIQRHAIVDKNKNEIPGAVKWIDDNYMVIGKAYFYKHDFFSAIETFNYVSKVYTNPHVKSLATMWMIRTYNEIGSFSLSEPLIDFLNNYPDFPKKLHGEFYAVAADYYLKREMYDKAVKYLSMAIPLSKKKKTRCRYSYILAQLYEKQNDNKKANQYYSQVIRLHPVYEMDFNARMRRAQVYEGGSGGSKSMKRTLAKMAKEEKNKEYLDQIYYAMASIEEKENNIPEAINYLKRSIEASVTNSNQKALSYLKLADIYFAKPNYRVAQLYYDSTIIFLSKDYPNYESIENKKKSLTSLINNLNTITLEDSLQKLGRMNEKDRDNFISALIAKAEQEEKEKQEKKEKQLINTVTNLPTTKIVGTGPNTGNWYFYNITTVGFGMNEFVKKWGNRKLEDNWRRSNKESGGIESEANQDATDTGAVKNQNIKAGNTVSDVKNKEYYLKNIPLTAEAVEKSNKRIMEAYYNAGGIYKEQLSNNSKSIETFEELMQRYPHNKHELSVYYQLYRIYLAINNNEKAEYYKNIILKDFPDTEYARIIKNPNYNKETAARRDVIEQFYTETYAAYSNGSYAEVISKCSYADSVYYKNFLMPKFDFLKALSIGRTQSVSAFEKALSHVVITYPKDSIKIKAEEILAVIKKQKNGGQAQPDSSGTKYIYDVNVEHYWITIVKNKTGDLNKFKAGLSDLNSKYFSLSDMGISSTFLDTARQIVMVKTFPSKDKAMEYYKLINEDKNNFQSLEENTYTNFVITDENYNLLLKKKDVSEYESFLKKNYLF